MRCLFTMFAEDVRLLRERIFSDAFDRWIDNPSLFPSEVEDLWAKMDKGGTLWGGGRIWRFNGGLFAEPFGLPLDRQQLQTLKRAAESDWADVEPAIFGTLLERALDPKERHRLGAHYTPRAYVERLVRPTIEEPLRQEWETVRATVHVLLASPGADTNRKIMAEARAEVSRFLERLTQVRILDPACGTGNFLYVSLDVLKRLENEALELYGQLEGAKLTHHGRLVSPQQFLGIEIKRWAKEIAELVLWIGYLQWQVRTKGFEHPDEPILRDYHNIECRDALLDYDEKVPLLDDDGNEVTRWDGVTMKRHPVTDEDVPDDTARVPVFRYVNPRKAEWPTAEFIVGNPPFVGTRRMRLALGDGYVEALAKAHPQMPENSDLVMYWWHLASEKSRAREARRFGLITTNSIAQIMNRPVLAQQLTATPPLSIRFAIPDHPWVDATEGASVRVAMTVGEAGRAVGVRYDVLEGESSVEGDATSVLTNPKIGSISDDLRVGANLSAAGILRANHGVAFWGVKFYGEGFIVDADRRQQVEEASGGSLLRPFVSGRDLTGRRRGLLAIDANNISERDLREHWPRTYQYLLNHVKPVRDQNPRALKRNRWWIFGENQPGMRNAVRGLSRYIATTETAKHRVFHMLDAEVLAEGTIAVIAVSDPFLLGVLSSRVHTTWAGTAGGTLEDRPRYNKTVCFDPFPFPPAGRGVSLVRASANTLTEHRNRQLERYASLTITSMYNVLEKLRCGEPLTEREKVTHEQGLVTILKQIHDHLDAAVFDAYGWPHDLTDEQILERLVALNAERAEEERRGIVRWLRPEFQNPGGTSAAAPQQKVIEIDGESPAGAAAAVKTERVWPKELPAQIAAVREVVTSDANAGWSAERTSRVFKGAKRAQVEAVLESLSALGLLVALGDSGERQWKSAG